MHRNGFTKRMKMTRNNNSEKELNSQSGDTLIQYSDIHSLQKQNKNVKVNVRSQKWGWG